MFVRTVPLCRSFFSSSLVTSKIPSAPLVTHINKKKGKVSITQETVDHLERLSLVDLGSAEGLRRLISAIEVAQQITCLSIENVEPLVSVLEKRLIFLRNDSVNEGSCREEIMANATYKKEEYFVAPPGNIPLIPRRRMEDNDSL